MTYNTSKRVIVAITTGFIDSNKSLSKKVTFSGPDMCTTFCNHEKSQIYSPHKVAFT